MKKEKQYIYITQNKRENDKCKIGITDNYIRRLKEYNTNKTGLSAENEFEYLYVCEVRDMKKVENDIKKEFLRLREAQNREIYFYNKPLFDDYVNFIKNHKLFIKAICVKKEVKKEKIKIIKKTTPSLEERGVTRKELLQKAQKIKNDEFYTRYEDVEKEINMYDINVWNNKCVFCNCDDAVGSNQNENNTSAFALYFIRNFKKLNLKQLICTHYVPDQLELGFADLYNAGKKGYIFKKTGYKEIGEYIYDKGYNGSFDHPLSIKILNEEADIICTNPPFSRMIEYWKIIIGSGKKFLIIAAMTNPITKAFIPYFKEKKVWAGFNRVDNFLNPRKELVQNRAYWYTNIPIKKRPKLKKLKIVPLKQIPKKYMKYDDNKILIVDNCFIPNDYKKPIAISIFPIFNGILEKGYKIVDKNASYVGKINGKEIFRRVLIQME